MAQRFYGEFADDQATEWRINIYDDEYSLATSSITLGAEGFVLSYEGAQDDMFQRIIPSKLTFSAHIRSSTAFETWVNEQMPRRGEAQIKVAVFEDPDGVNKLYWAGILLIDQVQLPDDYDAFIDFTASDGLALLQRDDYSSLSNSLNTKLATWLARNPVAEFWSAGAGFLRYVNDYYALGYTGSDYFDDATVQEPLNHSDTNFAGEPQEFTTYQKIEALMSAFNMRLFQAEGYWWAIPLTYYERIANSGVPSSLFRQVDKTGATVALTFFESQYLNDNKIYEDGVDATRMAGGNTLHLTGKKQVRITRISQDADFLYRSQSGQVPYQVLSAHGSTTNGLLYAEGTPFLIEGWASFFRYPDPDIAGDAALVTLRATFSLQVGSKYYNGTSWQDTSTTWTYDVEEFLRDSGTVSFLAPVNVETAPVPAEGDGLTFTATYRFINGLGTDVSSDMTNGLFGWQVILRLGNESSITNFTYAAETTEENFDDIDLADTLFGSFSPQSSSSYINGTIKYDGDYPEYYQGYTWAGNPLAGSSLLTLVTNDALRMTQFPVKVKQNGYLHEVPKMWQTVKQGTEYWVPLTISTVMNSRQSSVNRFLIDYDASNISDDSGSTGGGTSVGFSGFTDFDGVTSVNGETPDTGGDVAIDASHIPYGGGATVKDQIDDNVTDITAVKSVVNIGATTVDFWDGNTGVSVDTTANDVSLQVDKTDVLVVTGTTITNKQATIVESTLKTTGTLTAETGVGVTNILAKNSSTKAVIALQDSGSTDANQVAIASSGDGMVLQTGGAGAVSIDSTGQVGIGATAPSAQLDVVGDVEVTGSIQVKANTSTVVVGSGAGNYPTNTETQNTYVGFEAGAAAIATGIHHCMVGYRAGYSVTDADNVTAIGWQAGLNATGGGNVLIGNNAGQDVTGANNVFIGNYPGLNATSVAESVVVGKEAGREMASSYNVAIGARALRDTTTGGENVGVGFDALITNTTGTQNTAIGDSAGRSGNGSGNVFVGYEAGYSETGSNKLYIENSNSATPLIYGEFDNDLVRVNGALDVTGATTGTTFTGTGAIKGTGLEATSNADSLVLKSPDGTRWRVTVDNLGLLTTTSL